MEVAQFEEIQPEFMARVTRAIYCILTTVDGRGRPRSRVMHPIWEGPIGWVISWPQSHKATHLRRNPAVSLAYLPDRDRPVYVDGSAEWVGSAGERQRIWDLHRATPEPLGFDPEPYYGSIDHPYYGVLRIAPRRIELGNLGGRATDLAAAARALSGQPALCGAKVASVVMVSSQHRGSSARRQTEALGMADRTAYGTLRTSVPIALRGAACPTPEL